MKKLYKKDNGNITILVLIMAIVIILGTASMIAFVFRDIGFTKIDEGNLRALNFAEAGIADFQYKVNRYLTEGQELPASGYSEQISVSGEEEGSFTVNYEEIYEDDVLQGYEVVSRGTDKSEWQRTVKVYFSLGGSFKFDIYDYIYSSQSMNNGTIMASGTSIIGPFFTNGTLNLRGGVSFLEGPLFVNGDIILGGTSSIGEQGSPIELYLGGVLENANGNTIDPLNPGGENVYLSSFSRNLIELPMLVIDQDYINSLLGDVYEVNGDLTIADGSISESGMDDYLSFDSDGILHISGNILVNGNLILGSDKGAPNVIRYEGSAKIITTGNISVFYQLVTSEQTIFPQDSLLLLMSMSDIYLDFKKSLGKPEGEFVAIANNNMELDENTVIWGSLIADHLIVNNNSKIYYIEGLREYLPDDLPDYSLTLPDTVIMETWQEIGNQ
ncbi:MAG: hypothetical protein ACQEP5_06660 [Actinomycetota bacterium]